MLSAPLPIITQGSFANDCIIIYLCLLDCHLQRLVIVVRIPVTIAVHYQRIEQTFAWFFIKLVYDLLSVTFLGGVIMDMPQQFQFCIEK